MAEMSNKKKIIIAIVVFAVTFVVFKEIFSNWGFFQSLFKK